MTEQLAKNLQWCLEGDSLTDLLLVKQVLQTKSNRVYESNKNQRCGDCSLLCFQLTHLNKLLSVQMSSQG